MAEILGTAASVIAVLQLAGQLTVLGYGYIGGVKKAPKSIQQVVDELQSLSGALENLQACIDSNPGSLALQKLDGPDGRLQQCARDLEELQSKLAIKPGRLRAKIVGLTWPLKEKEAMEYIMQLERHKNHFILTVTVEHLSQTNSAAEIQELERIAADRARALSWLFDDDFKDRHPDISSRRRENTGDWLFKTPELQSWTDDQTNSLLVGYGIPGAGKTFLSSAVIDKVEARAKTANHGLAHVYFNYKEQDQQTPINVLRSLIKQLAYRIPHLPQEIAALHDEYKKGGRNPTLNDLCATILATSKQFSRVFFIFDALDECDPETQRKALLPLFHTMVEGGISVFLTSRPHPQDIKNSFQGSAQIELKAATEDISSYIQAKIDEHPEAKRLVLQGNCQDRIISELTDCANGMFLLVHFHIKHLCQQTTTRQILTELSKLKKASTEESPLDPTYDRAMETLRGQSKNRTGLALRTLSWLVKARHPLKIDELQTAVSIEAGRYKLDELDFPDKTTLLDVCASLVVIDENTKIVRLAHYTVQEYLLRDDHILRNAELTLATACTTYLSFDIFADGPGITGSYFDRAETYPLTLYAAENLTHHLQSCDEDATKDIVLRFLKRPGNRFSYLKARQYYPMKLPALHTAAIMGHAAVTQLLLLKGYASPADQVEEKYTALHFAAKEGNKAVAQLLLEKGADISAPAKNGDTALHLAVQSEMAQLLLDKGADISASNENGETALHYAAKKGNAAVVQLLLEKGADTSASDKDGKTALHYAVEKKDTAVAQLLLEKGADISASDKDGKTALHFAILLPEWILFGEQRGMETVQLLLEKGADISASSKDGKTALHYAAKEGDTAVAQLLLEKGADTSASDKDGKTALHYVVEKKDTAVVQLLLKKGADTSASDKDGKTALHCAVEKGNTAVVQLLLKKGADISASDKDGKTALHYAVVRRDTAVFQLLLKKGADISASDKNGKTALHFAAKWGRVDVVQLLLNKGADISAADKSGMTVLHFAASHWAASHWTVEEKVAELERAIDSNVWFWGKREGTELHPIAKNRKWKVVQLLLERGADITILNNSGKTALDLAAVDGYENIVELLAAATADSKTATHELDGIIEDKNSNIDSDPAGIPPKLEEIVGGKSPSIDPDLTGTLSKLEETVEDKNPSINPGLIDCGSPANDLETLPESEITIDNPIAKHPRIHETYNNYFYFAICALLCGIFIHWSKFYWGKEN